MSELTEAFRELNRFCDAHDYRWDITRPSDGTFGVIISDGCRNHGCSRNGKDLATVIQDVVQDARRILKVE